MNYWKAGKFRDGLGKATPMATHRVGFDANENTRKAADQLSYRLHRRHFVRERGDLILIEHASAVAVGREELPNI